eukprot:SAG22_NODE_13_length_33548_cov_57.167773_12_plen_680_part_00
MSCSRSEAQRMRTRFNLQRFRLSELCTQRRQRALPPNRPPALFEAGFPRVFLPPPRPAPAAPAPPPPPAKSKQERERQASSQNMSEFHAACAAGDRLSVELALEIAGDDGALELLRSREPGNDPGGQTPLHTACSHGHASVVGVLLAAAPYSGTVLGLTASKRAAGQQRRAEGEPSGPPETPQELASRLGQRKVLVAIDQFVDHERDLAQEELGRGLTALSTGDVVRATVAARRGLQLDPQSADCRLLFDMAAGKLAAESEALLAAGDPDGAFALAGERLALAPESEQLADVCGRSELLSAKLKAAKARSTSLGGSLVQYERAATKMVSDAHAEKRKAEQGRKDAEAEAARMSTWCVGLRHCLSVVLPTVFLSKTVPFLAVCPPCREGKCAEQARLNDKLRGMWQARAIRKLRMMSIETALTGWRSVAAAAKRGRQIIAHTAHKLHLRWELRAFRGWVKYTQHAHVHQAQEEAEKAEAAAKQASRERQDAEWARDAADTRAASAGDRQAHSEAKAAQECNLRAAAERREAAALAEAAEQKRLREAAETLQVRPAGPGLTPTWGRQSDPCCPVHSLPPAQKVVLGLTVCLSTHTLAMPCDALRRRPGTRWLPTKRPGRRRRRTTSTRRRSRSCSSASCSRPRRRWPSCSGRAWPVATTPGRAGRSASSPASPSRLKCSAF